MFEFIYKITKTKKIIFYLHVTFHSTKLPLPARLFLVKVIISEETYMKEL